MLVNLLPNDFILSETYFWELLCSFFSDFSSWGKISTLTIFSQYFEHCYLTVPGLYSCLLYFTSLPAFAKYEEDMSKIWLSLCIF